MKALVTGANGFLGQHVVAALLERGVEVRAIVRPAAHLDGLAWPARVEVFRADLRASTDLGRALEGVDALVHLAASFEGGEDGMFASTVVGTERLLGAVRASACRHVILASSLSVYDWSAVKGTLDEDSPLEPAPDLYERDGYAIAKSWQERVARRMARDHGFDLTVLRPGFIWGRDHALLAAMGVRVGRVQLVIGPLSPIPMTHVENCSDIFAAAVTDARARGATLNVVDGPGPRIWTFVGEYLRGTGESVVRVPVPYRAALLAVRIAHRTLFRRNLRLPQILIPVRFEARLKPLRFSNRRARELLGWEAPLDHGSCLARTFAGERERASDTSLAADPGRPGRAKGGAASSGR